MTNAERTESETPRESLATRLGFIFLSAGCAIGLGNVWRFPTVVGKNGGGWFVLLYLVFLVLLALPVLVMEFATGRAAQRSIAQLHATLTPKKKAWRAHGLAGSIGNLILMMFYTTVTGWMIIYFLKMASGAFSGLDTAQVGAAFSGMLADAKTMTLAMLGVTLSSAAVCAMGLQKGVERVSKVLMMGLLALIVVLAINSLCLKGAGEGVRFYLVPDWARFRSVGILTVITEAMNQAFFTLSLGIGAMSIFGSYLKRDRTLLGEAINVGFLDTFVALMAGLIILPACFAFGVAPAVGPGLVFVTLPNVFNQMSLGRVWGSLFFLFMSFAALTTVLAVFETILSCLRDYTGWSRAKGCWILAAVVPLLSLPCVFGFNVWSGFQPLGAGSCVLDLEDFIVSNLLLPLGAISFVVYTTRRFGWGWKNFLAEANAGEGVKLVDRPYVRVFCAYVLPMVIGALFLAGLWSKFAR